MNNLLFSLFPQRFIEKLDLLELNFVHSTFNGLLEHAFVGICLTRHPLRFSPETQRVFDFMHIRNVLRHTKSLQPFFLCRWILWCVGDRDRDLGIFLDLLTVQRVWVTQKIEIQVSIKRIVQRGNPRVLTIGSEGELKPLTQKCFDVLESCFLLHKSQYTQATLFLPEITLCQYVSRV